MLQRQIIMAGLALVGLLGSVPSRTVSAGDLPAVRVYKSATCGCCGKWVEHLRRHGFTVETSDVTNLREVKRKAGVPATVGSCHTALVGDYFVEGHVPPGDIERLVETKPAVKGIAVPGMPIGSPGMEGPNPEAYRVLSVHPNGELSAFARHGP